MKFPQSSVVQVVKEILEGATVVKHSPRLVINARCPICGDSKKSKRKKRLWIHENEDWYSIVCYNCNASTNLYSYLKEHHADKFDQLKSMCFDQIKDGTVFKKDFLAVRQPKKPTDKLDIFLRGFLRDHCFILDQPQDTPKKEKLRKYAIKKMKDRNIPDKYWSDFYFCYKGKYKFRVIIPFVDDVGLLYYFQARDIDPNPNELKYLTSSFDDIALPDNRIYNFHHADKNKNVLICEGMLDSLFVDNAIALCNANIKGYNIKLIKDSFPKRIWILDSPWVDKTGYERTMELLDMGEACFIMPKEHKTCKDLNDVAIKLNVKHLPYDFISSNTLSGRTGMVKLKVMMLGRWE